MQWLTEMSSVSTEIQYEIKIIRRKEIFEINLKLIQSLKMGFLVWNCCYKGTVNMLDCSKAYMS